MQHTKYRRDSLLLSERGQANNFNEILQNNNKSIVGTKVPVFFHCESCIYVLYNL